MRGTLVVGAVVLAACALPSSAPARTTPVRPGQSIQAALDRSRAGDVVTVAPGVYRERGRRCPAEPARRCALVLARTGVRLLARPRPSKPVVLRPRRRGFDGIAIGRSRSPACTSRRARRVSGVTVAGFRLVGFRDAVTVACATRFRVHRVRALRSIRHGIAVLLSDSGRVDRSLVRGARRAGILIAQSRGVRADHVTATAAAAGFEIDNGTAIRLDHNRATANSVGFVTFALPGLAVRSSAGNRLDHNRAGANNRSRLCRGRPDAVCRLRPGVGITVVGGDGARVEANRVSRNRVAGIAVESVCTGLRLPGPACLGDLDVEPNPDRTFTVANRTLGNAVDLRWDQTGGGNCWQRNVAAVSSPAVLPDCLSRSPGPVAVGIGEQSMSFFGDPSFGRLGIRRARLIVPWNLTDSTLELDYVGNWLATAQASNIEPLVHFTTTSDSRCPDDPCRLPSVEEYGAAFRAFRARFPTVTTLGVWNEANHPSQPTFEHPDVAAAYYLAAREACPQCTLVAADILDSSNMSSWVRAFQQAAGPVDLWGLHNYRDANTLDAGPGGGTAHFLAITSGQVWLTETGGVVKFVTPSGTTQLEYDEQRASSALDRSFAIAAAYRSRIARMYLYNWLAPPPGYRWDSGLVNNDGSPRPGYFTVGRWMREPRFGP